MTMNPLIALLPDAPLDIVGDIHGEIDALRDLAQALGYAANGAHPQGRRLMLVGDLIDRGPDSLGVVRWVAQRVERGRASCVMGNHDLNAVLGVLKPENAWLLGDGPVSSAERDEVQAFLRTLPLAMERDDLRVVHACWSDEALGQVAGETGVIELYRQHAERIALKVGGMNDPVERNLAMQNDHPVKLITSGPEHRAGARFFAGGKWRGEARTRWWDSYKGPTCVFGHYSRPPAPGTDHGDGLFDGVPMYATLANGQAMCIDYCVGGRAGERRQGRPEGSYVGRLAALRWPERELVFDDGARHPMEYASMVA